MYIIFFVKNIFRKWKRGRHLQEILESRKKIQEFRFKKRLEKREERKEQIAKIKIFPIKVMTQEEVDLLTKAGDPPLDLNICPLGTWVLCKKLPELPQVRVVGHVVDFDKAFCSQAGGAILSRPKRFLNRYILQVV